MKHKEQVPKIDLILALSKSLDLISPTVSGHHLRVAYLAFRIGQELNLNKEPLKDLVIAGLLHDVGAISFKERMDSLEFDMKNPNLHAKIGYHLIKKYKSFEKVAEIIKYHHIRWDETDVYKRHNIEIPFSSYILQFSDRVDVLRYRTSNTSDDIESVLRKILPHRGKKFNPQIVDVFSSIISKSNDIFQMENNSLCNTFGSILEDIFLDIDDLVEITKIFENIIDFRNRFTATHSSGVANTAVMLSKLVGFSESDTKLMRVAGQLHDIGKLGIPGYLIEKPGKLSTKEMSVMRNHALYTYMVLNEVRGFIEVAELAALHHEKINGLGYPFNKKAKDLSVGSRIMAVSDIFTAVMEDRPYRKGMNKEDALKILDGMIKNKEIDGDIVSLLRKNYDVIDEKRKIVQSQAAKEFQNFWNQVDEEKL